MLTSTSLDIVRPRLPFLLQLFSTSMQWTHRWFSVFLFLVQNLRLIFANKAVSRHCRRSKICSFEVDVFHLTHFFYFAPWDFFCLVDAKISEKSDFFVLFSVFHIFIFFKSSFGSQRYHEIEKYKINNCVGGELILGFWFRTFIFFPSPGSAWAT